MHCSRRALLPLLAAALTLGGWGCGNPGSPLPPSLMLPQPVTDLSATRTGDIVTLHWTTTRRTTDRVVLRGEQRGAVCRATGAGACLPVGVVITEPSEPAHFADTLPPSLREGSARLLRYEVHLQNRRKRNAGSSNFAYAAAGWAPPAVLSVAATPTAKGIAVSWQTAATHPADSGHATRLVARLMRTWLPEKQGSSKASQPRPQPQPQPEPEPGVPQPLQQILESAEHAQASAGAPWQPEHTLDAGVLFNRRYRYGVQLLEQVTLSGHVLTIAGEGGKTGVVDARDTFPPAVPADLAAVANAEGGAIDLSWSADAAPDLAGYIVYRRLAGSSASPVAVSGKAPLTGPAWSDAHAQRGVRYAYSVSAVDTSGNRSAPSAEVTEALP